MIVLSLKYVINDVTLVLSVIAKTLSNMCLFSLIYEEFVVYWNSKRKFLNRKYGE